MAVSFQISERHYAQFNAHQTVLRPLVCMHRTTSYHNLQCYLHDLCTSLAWHQMLVPLACAPGEWEASVQQERGWETARMEGEKSYNIRRAQYAGFHEIHCSIYSGHAFCNVEYNILVLNNFLKFRINLPHRSINRDWFHIIN